MTGLAPTRLLAALAALALAGAGGGCSLPPRLEHVAHEGGAPGRTAEPFDWPRPVRVGVKPDGGGHGRLHRRVVGALHEGFDRLVVDYRRSRATEPVDYVVDVDITVHGEPHGTNFLVVFPGFAIFMPTWFPLRYDYTVTTTVDLTGAGGRTRTLTLTDRFLLRYTPVGVSVGAYIGLGSIVFPPLLLSPLVTGGVAALEEWDPHAFSLALSRDPEAGRRYGSRVAQAVRHAIDADLRFE
ncbi:MAG: hypothetical protein M9894_28875 [Planctomycetes bacterium]|nr:hypothetical protein [Planctomycetota bacterium]